MAMVRRFIRQSPDPAPAPPRTHPARPSRCCGHRRGVHPCSHAIRAPRSPSARRSCSAPRPAILTDTSKSRHARLFFDTCIKEATPATATGSGSHALRDLGPWPPAASHGSLQVQVVVGLRAHQSSWHPRSSPKRRLCPARRDTQQASHPHASVPGLARHVRCRLDDDHVVDEVAASTATAIDGQPDAGRTCPGQRHAVSPRHRHVNVAGPAARRADGQPATHPGKDAPGPGSTAVCQVEVEVPVRVGAHLAVRNALAAAIASGHIRFCHEFVDQAIAHATPSARESLKRLIASQQRCQSARS